MKIDNDTITYFSNIKQVFLYVSDKCNLLCEQCLYKPNVLIGREIPLDTSKQLLKIFNQLGAFKLTILGGEISLYDIDNNYSNLIELINYAHEIGYSYIRIDTNGQERNFFKNEKIFKYLNEVSFSIDGYDELTNDSLRGKAAFQNSITSLKTLQEMCTDTQINITTCVTKQNTLIAGGIKAFIEKMINFSAENDVSQLNLHGVFKMGVPMDTWTGNSHLDPIEWYTEIGTIVQNIKQKKYPIDIRFPIHIVTRKEFNDKPKYYGYCPCKLGERALIHPDGIIRVCSSMLSTPYGVAHYNSEEIRWNYFNNELQNHKMNEYTPCTNQKAMYVADYCPVCFSIKPFQNEPVWQANQVEALRGENSEC